ncbi:DUF4230 domain-containing protein [Persicirhabdus sediminis]|uniref:DUF4230 domain-containing protein n=1 Tax=Persicirhabdus sediminis TaxID=454144 RepID=A0A8J7MFM4_9BACT|nr:DUF4230 domain-containing protein [Persicirhabdus sediminis]MBK1792317.1 DUF4230 domain-containing protein [Persicirhabdus sediminis]
MADYEQTEKSESRRSPHTVIWSLCGGVALLMVVGFSCFHFFVAKPVHDSASRGISLIEKAASAMGIVFNEKVEIKGNTAVLAKAKIEELAVCQRKTQVIVKYKTQWWGSEKMLIVRGDFLVKAGFDLSAGGQWSIIDGRMSGDFPEAKVLSVEPVGDFEIYYSQGGIINQLSSEDHLRAFNALKNQARRDAENSDIMDEASGILRQRFRDLMDGQLLWEEQLP